jgi:thiopurine S-methyltransferase
MTPDFWLARWQQGEIGWHEDRINLHLSRHWPRLGVAPEERVFVPLCGKSLDLLWLAGQGYRVLGVEISRLAVDAFFAENHLVPQISEESPFLRYRSAQLEILCGDFFDLAPAHLDGVLAVYDRASLIAIPPEVRPSYATQLQEVLRGDVRMLLITLHYDQWEMLGPPFSVKEREVHSLFDGRFGVESLARIDVLEKNQRFRQRGLTRLTEVVYGLGPRDTKTPEGRFAAATGIPALC